MLDGWIVTAPIWHPLWSQYFIGLIDLADRPDCPPAILHRPGMTHEVAVMSLSPDHGPYDADLIGDRQTMVYLAPANVVEQFATEDDRAREVITLLVQAVLNGMLSPEASESPEAIRLAWAQSIHQTLDHYRDPHHGMAN